MLQDMGGWIAFCGCSEQEKPFRNREFEKRYQGYVLQPPTDYPRKLVGITESSNGMRGLTEWVKPPMLAGDEKKALEVYNHGTARAVSFQRMNNAVVMAIEKLGEKV